MSNLAKTFRDLHDSASLLILSNAWDAGSARVFEDTGTKAIATTSAGVAWALGYPDGNALPVEKLAAVVASITNVIRVPLSVDVEGGYTDELTSFQKTVWPTPNYRVCSPSTCSWDSIVQMQRRADRSGALGDVKK
jgi:2-methylisocitrate lyase-like PEP mutase family enzyme